MPPNPVGAGGAWTQTVKKEAAIAGEELDKKQIELIQKVTAYFNQMTEIKGLFVQTSADNKRMRGKFYVKRPGRFRFDYNLPSRMVILSDGQYIAIQDLDLKTDDRVELDRTPFRVLLRKDVDLMRDAQILEVQEVDDVDRARPAGPEPRQSRPYQVVSGQETRPRARGMDHHGRAGPRHAGGADRGQQDRGPGPWLFKPANQTFQKLAVAVRRVCSELLRRTAIKLGKTETIRNNFVISRGAPLKRPLQVLFVVTASGVALHR